MCITFISQLRDFICIWEIELPKHTWERHRISLYVMTHIYICKLCVSKGKQMEMESTRDTLFSGRIHYSRLSIRCAFSPPHPPHSHTFLIPLSFPPFRDNPSTLSPSLSLYSSSSLFRCSLIYIHSSPIHSRVFSRSLNNNNWIWIRKITLYIS